MEEGERKQFAERLHEYSNFPGIPDRIQTDLIAASVLINSGSMVGEPEKKEEQSSSFEMEEPISTKYMVANEFDAIGYAKEILQRYGNKKL